MSVYKEVYGGAALVAGFAAAVLIRRPWAYYVTASIGTMVADPEGMMDSAKSWVTPVLKELAQGLDELKTLLKEQGTWEGEAFKAFAAVHSTFKASIATLEEARTNTSEAVGSTSDLYKVGASFCATVAMGMFSFGMWKWIFGKTPVTVIAAEGADAATGAVTTAAMKKALKKHGLAAGALAFLLYMLKGQTQSAGKVFPTLEAVPTQTTLAMKGNYTIPFMNDGLEYDKNSGTLLPKADESGYPA